VRRISKVIGLDQPNLDPQSAKHVHPNIQGEPCGRGGYACTLQSIWVLFTRVSSRSTREMRQRIRYSVTWSKQNPAEVQRSRSAVRSASAVDPIIHFPTPPLRQPKTNASRWVGLPAPVPTFRLHAVNNRPILRVVGRNANVA
jgi:hypothetical protein